MHFLFAFSELILIIIMLQINLDLIQSRLLLLDAHVGQDSNLFKS